MKSAFILFLFPLFLIGVFGDDVEYLMEGDSITLYTDTKIQNDEVIDWMFGQYSIASLNSGTTGKVIPVIKPDGPFKDRLQLDNQTGDLRIMKIRFSDSGTYSLEIRRFEKSASKTFNLKVSDTGVKSLFMLVGESFTLQTGIPDIQNGVVQWRFKHQNTTIAEINRTAGRFFISYSVDGRFRQKLQLDYWTGSLTIRNIKTEHSGLYEADISTNSSSKHTIHKSFNVTVRGEVKSVSVTEGESVTLKTDITEIQRDDQILWMFGQSHIAEIHKATQLYYIYDGPDGRFRDRLKLDNQTGSLTITNIRTEHDGLYDLKISSSRHAINKRFTVSISAVPDSGLSAGNKAWIAIALLLCVVATVAGLFYYHRKISEIESQTLKSLSVTEGMDVILKTDFKLHGDEKINWMFGDNATTLATIAGSANKEPNNDGLDNIFSDTLELDKNTGSLTIKNIRMKHAGFYELQIQRDSNSLLFKSFKLAVFGSDKSNVFDAGDPRESLINSDNGIIMETM